MLLPLSQTHAKRRVQSCDKKESCVVIAPLHTLASVAVFTVLNLLKTFTHPTHFLYFLIDMYAT